MKNRIFIVVFALLFAVLFLVSCSGNSGKAQDTDDNSYDGKFEYNTFAGVIVSAGETKIEKREGFDVSEIKVEVGDLVKEGDVLFVYDTQKAALDLERAKLELEQLQNKQQNLIETKERLEKEKASAIAEQQLSYSLEIRETETDILEGEYNIKLKNKEIDNLSKSLEITEEKSPVTGKVSSINREGQDSYGNPQAFMVITETGSMRVQGYINENNMSDINIGTEVTIKSRVDEITWHGTVSEINTEKPEQGFKEDYYSGYDEGISADSSSKYPFYIELDDSDGLMLGQHVYIIVEAANDPDGGVSDNVFNGAGFQDGSDEYDDIDTSFDSDNAETGH